MNMIITLENVNEALQSCYSQREHNMEAFCRLASAQFDSVEAAVQLCLSSPQPVHLLKLVVSHAIDAGEFGFAGEVAGAFGIDIELQDRGLDIRIPGGTSEQVEHLRVALIDSLHRLGFTQAAVSISKQGGAA